MPNFDYAIAELRVALETAEKNAPAWEAEGNADQATASRQHADSFRAAITALEHQQ